MNEIVHLIDSGGLYGAEKVVLYLMAEQQRQGRKVRLVSYGAARAGEKPLEREAVRLGLTVEAWRGQSGSRLKKELARLGGPRVYHSHGYKFNILLALSGGAKKAHLCVATLHGFTDAPLLSRLRLYYALDRWSLRHLDGVAFVSEATAQKAGITPGQGAYRIIHNGISDAPEPQSQAPTPKSLGIKGEYILALGRLSREKGLDLLLKAFARTVVKYPNVSLVIAGDGPEKESLFGLASALDLDDKVVFTGYLAEPLALLTQARLLAMPSQQEGLPITLLEAMRGGVDVLASAVGEIPRVTRQGEGAYLVPPDDLGALSQGLEAVLSEPKGRWGKPAQTLFKNGFTASAMAEAYQCWYDALKL